MKAATRVREIEKATFSKTHSDYDENVVEIEKAIEVEEAELAAHGSFLQLSDLKNTDIIPAGAKQKIDAFLSTDYGLTVEQPEADSYESHSGGVLDTFEKLDKKFIDERTNLEKQEMNSQHEFEMLVQDLNAQITEDTKNRDEKAESKAAKLQAKATAEGDLAETTATRDADSKYLKDLTATCQEKADAFESRQKLRAEEIEAIEKAIEIISDASVSGAADKHLPALMQKSSFAQLRVDTSSSTQQRAAAFLQRQAQQSSSRVLAALAVRVSDDPFVKVKKMIKDMIVKLTEEAAEEAEHKAWCDSELSTNEQTRKQKTAEAETLHAEIDELEASIAKLTEDMSDASTAIAELDAAMAKATELRTAEKEKNTETIADAKAAAAAVEKALGVLKDFYAKAAEATAFVQQKQKQPEIFDEEYKGMGSSSGGVVGMLEVILSDFTRLDAETTSAEETAQKEYDEFMTDSKDDKAQKTSDIERKTGEKQDQSQTLSVKKGDLEGTQEELDAALAYFDKLKPTCVNTGMSYEDRVARRKEEVESLQQALKILSGESI